MRIPLAEMTRRARNPRRRTITLQPIKLPATRATNLYREAYAPIITMWQAALPGIMAEYSRSLAAITTDSAATIETEIQRGATQAGAFLLAVRARIEAWARLAEAWHRSSWRRVVLSGTGVDLATMIGPQDMREPLEAVIARNVGLVTSVSDETRRRIADAVFRGYQARRPARDVARELSEAVAIGRRRALRIAADQNVKLSSALNEERRRQAGIDSFTWVHSGKVHPRAVHVERNGKLYSEDPAKVGSEYEGRTIRKVPDDKPGELPFCGCTSKAVLILEASPAAASAAVAPTATPPPAQPARIASVNRPRRMAPPPPEPAQPPVRPPQPGQGFRSPVNPNVTEASIRVEKRIELQKRMSADLARAAADPRYGDIGKYRGRSERDFGRASFSTEWSDEAVSVVAALKPELDDLADQIGIPRLRGFKTTAGSQNADMGGGVMALSPGEFNARSAKVGGGSAEDLAEHVRAEAEIIRQERRALQPDIERLRMEMLEARAAGDGARFEQLRAQRDPLVKRYNALYTKLQKSTQAAGRANRVASTPQTSWRPGDDPKSKPWSVAYYYPEGIDRVRSTLFHEFAHHVHQNLNRVGAYGRPLEAKLRELWAQTRDVPGHRDRLPSAYAHTNQHEWFAENFSLFVMGKKDLADPVLVDLIERIFRGEFK